MSSDILLDKDTHDIVISKGDLVIAEGGDYVLQNVKQAVLIMFNEHFLKRTRGVPYIEQILKKNPDRAIVNASFTRAILSVEGVRKLQRLDIDIDIKTREASVSFVALSEYGTIRDSVEIFI